MKKNFGDYVFALAMTAFLGSLMYVLVIMILSMILPHLTMKSDNRIDALDIIGVSRFGYPGNIGTTAGYNFLTGNYFYAGCSDISSYNPKDIFPFAQSCNEASRLIERPVETAVDADIESMVYFPKGSLIDKNGVSICAIHNKEMSPDNDQTVRDFLERKPLCQAFFEQIF